MPLPNAVRQKAARDTLAQVFAQPATAYAIHYACQSFHDGSQVGSSMRIVSIALRQLGSGQVTAFSIAKMAELYRLQPQDVPGNWNGLERAMLGEFYDFIRTNRQARFVHWNMRDDRFGFAALEHRSRVLKGHTEDVPEANRVDLAQLMVDLYGDDYVTSRAKLEAIAKLNNLVMTDFLPGGQEAEAMNAGRLRDVHASTLTKVRLLAEVAMRAHDRTLKTQAGLLARHGGPARLMAHRLIENPGYTLVSGLVGGFVVVFKAYDWLFGG